MPPVSTAPDRVSPPVAPNAQADLLFVYGLETSRACQLNETDPWFGKFEFKVEGNSSVQNLMATPELPSHRLLLTGQPFNIRPPKVLVNCISNPDRLSERLTELSQLIRELKQRSPDLRVINPPEGIEKTRRESIYSQFVGLPGLFVPRVARFSARSRRDFVAQVASSGLKFPLLVREAGTHRGENIIRIEDLGPEALDTLDAFSFDGREFIVTEFCDYARADGLYRKMRLVMVGDKVHIRHMIATPNWNVHARNRNDLMVNDPALRAEEKAFIERGLQNFTPQQQAALRHIVQTLALDFFGIDCALDEAGRLVIFEINASIGLTGPIPVESPYLLPNLQAIAVSTRQLVLPHLKERISPPEKGIATA